MQLLCADDAAFLVHVSLDLDQVLFALGRAAVLVAAMWAAADDAFVMQFDCDVLECLQIVVVFDQMLIEPYEEWM